MSDVLTQQAADPATGIDVALAALRAEVGEESIGELVGTFSELSAEIAENDGARVLTHAFACSLAGYPGWYWAVTVVVLPDVVTIDELVLLPGDGAILAPGWVPYRERIQPGDLSPGDILPTDEDDPRLAPAYLSGDEPVDDVQTVRLVSDELGLGRVRVLSAEGREGIAQRWYDGPQGPDSQLALQAAHKCVSCGFLMLLKDSLGTSFGVCANEYANDDGRVVALRHGCGAHSEAQLRRKQLPQPLADPVLDTTAEELDSF